MALVRHTGRAIRPRFTPEFPLELQMAVHQPGYHQPVQRMAAALLQGEAEAVQALPAEAECPRHHRLLPEILIVATESCARRK